MTTLHAEPNIFAWDKVKSHYAQPLPVGNQDQTKRQSNSQIKKRLFEVSSSLKHQNPSETFHGNATNFTSNEFIQGTSKVSQSVAANKPEGNPEHCKIRSALPQSKRESLNFSINEPRANRQNESSVSVNEDNKMKHLLNTLEFRGMEIQGQVRILSQERDHFNMLYEETRRELNRTREELIACEESYSRSFVRMEHLLNIAEGDKEKVLTEMHRQSAESNELRKQVTMLNSQLNEANQKLSVLQDRISHITRDKEQLQYTLEQNQMTKSLLQEKVDHLTAEVTQQREKVSRLEQDYLDEKRKCQEVLVKHEKKLCEEEELIAQLHRYREEKIHLEELVKEKTYQWTHIREALTEREKNVTYLSEQVRSREMQLKAYDMKLTSLCEENRKLQNEVTHSHATMRQLSAEASDFKSEIVSLKSQNNELIKEAKCQSDAMKQAESEILHLTNKSNTLQEELKDHLSESKLLRVDLDSMKANLQDTEKELLDMQVALRGAEEENLQFRNTQSLLESQISSLQSHIDNLTIQLNEYEADKVDLLKGLRDLRFVCTQLEDTKMELLALLRTKEMEIEDFHVEVAELHENFREIRNQLDNEESNRQNLQIILESSREKENISRVEIQNMQGEINSLRETVTVLTESLEKSKHQVNTLQETNHRLEIELQCLQRDYSNEKFEKMQLQTELRIHSLVPPEHVQRDGNERGQTSRGFI